MNLGPPSPIEEREEREDEEREEAVSVAVRSERTVSARQDASEPVLRRVKRAAEPASTLDHLSFLASRVSRPLSLPEETSREHE